MMSLLIISPDKTKREDYALQICKEQDIDSFDITTVASEQAIGITDVRNMQKKLSLKPLKGKQKAMIIKDAHTATVDSQNALLKALEEPPANTIIILTATTEHAFLPTIVSRCRLIYVEKSGQEPSQEEQIRDMNVLKSLQQTTIAEKLKLAQDLAKEKEKAIAWLENMIKTARLVLVEQTNTPKEIHNYIFMLQLLQKAHVSMQTTNVQARFLLEYTFLNL